MPCPFCMIAGGIPPSSSPEVLTSPLGSAYPILSTPTVVAFLDIAPIARGHVLLCPRKHATKVTDLAPATSAAMGFWLPILSRSVMKAIFGEKGEEGSWNVLQANGAEAGQTISHAHFHIIPRLGSAQSAIGQSDMSDAERANLILGEGPRAKLEHDEGSKLSGLLKAEVANEVNRLKGEGLLDFGDLNGELWVRLEDRGLKL